MKLIPELRIRAAVRPNVWTTLKLEFEALSHLEQYTRDLVWDEDGARRLLAKRIEGFLRLTGKWDQVKGSLPSESGARERLLISLVFEETIPWGKRTRPVHVALFTLSKHRPRWMIELCKIAAARAVAQRRTLILHDDVMADLASFGNRRIEDTSAEFGAQCPELGELIAAFRREPEQLTTDQLLSTIQNKILTHLTPRIVGALGKATSLDVAAFLFQIGFFFGRQDFSDGSYEHITYSQRPHLFKARSSLDDGLIWEIHPVFRQALEMRDAAGREIRTPRRG
jgi:hypothetical protein